MIEWKAVIIAAVMLVCYVLYLKLKLSAANSDAEPSNIESNTKLLIDELHKLTEQHTNLVQFLFDTEQEKDSRYSISYKTADNTTKTAEIIKAVDSTPYIKQLTQQQITAIESRITAIIRQLNTTIPHHNATSNKAVYVAEKNVRKTTQYIRKTIDNSKSGDTLKGTRGEQ